MDVHVKFIFIITTETLAGKVERAQWLREHWLRSKSKLSDSVHVTDYYMYIDGVISFISFIGVKERRPKPSPGHSSKTSSHCLVREE